VSTEQPYFLETSRLGFRHWCDGDLPLAMGLWGDPAVTRFIDNRRTLSQHDVAAMLQKNLKMQEEYGIQYWPIFRLDSGEHVGCCGLRPYDSPSHIYEFGVHICVKWWRHGVAEEAARGVIQYAFEYLGAAALFAGHNPDNNASEALLRKLGFRYTHRELYAATGLDHLCYLLSPQDVLFRNQS